MPLPSIPDYSNCIKTPALVHPEVLNGGHPVEKGVRLIKYAGGFCVVFPYETAARKYSVFRHFRTMYFPRVSVP